MDPHRQEELTEEATFALASGDAVRALALGDQITAMDPEDPVARVIRAHALLASGSPEDAFLEAQIAVLLDPENEDTQIVLALAAWRTGRTPVADEAFRLAYQHSGENPRFGAQLAWFLANERPAKHAIQIAQQVIAADRRTPIAWAALGIANLRLHRNQEAEEAIQQAMAIDPESPEAQSAMVRLLKRRGDTRQADALAALLSETKRRWPPNAHSENDVDEATETIRPADLIVRPTSYRWSHIAFVFLIGIVALALIVTKKFPILIGAILVAGLIYAFSLGRRLRKPIS